MSIKYEVLKSRFTYISQILDPKPKELTDRDLLILDAQMRVVLDTLSLMLKREV